MTEMVELIAIVEVVLKEGGNQSCSTIGRKLPLAKLVGTLDRGMLTA